MGNNQTNKIKAFKGFNKDMTCRGFKYEEGKTYEINETPVRCTKNGFHSCENPIDIFGYYNPAESVFREVEADGQIDRSTEDTKIASSKITIGAEINLKSIVEMGIKFIFSKCDWSKKEESSTGNHAGSQATGNQAGSQATGYQAGSQATGNQAISSVNGNYSKSEIINKDEIESKNSVAIGIGVKNQAKASINNWIVLSEWNNDFTEIVSIKTAKVDGKKIKADTWYELINKKFVQVKL